ncbi:MAG: hypothetical protein GY811_03390 [Myxococcales bacterium]|nr:hypothetical protein [Myxococcales bacterium]
MPVLQLRGFLIGLASLAALLFTLLPGATVTNAENKKAVVPAALVKPRIAVLYFDYSGNDEEMGFLRKGMAQMLVTDLSAKGDLQIVERVDLEAILEELKLGRTNKIDPKSRNKIGKLLGARYLVTGGYFQFRNSLRVDAKIIDVERGTTKSYSAQASPNDFMKIESELTTKLHAALLKLNAKNATSKKPSRKGKTASHKTRKSPKVAARTVARYGRALDALDKGNKKIAASELETVMREAPHFKPAVDDLRVLLR